MFLIYLFEIAYYALNLIEILDSYQYVVMIIIISIQISILSYLFDNENKITIPKNSDEAVYFITELSKIVKRKTSDDMK